MAKTKQDLCEHDDNAVVQFLSGLTCFVCHMCNDFIRLPNVKEKK